MRRGQLHVVKLDRDFVWLDAGTADSLLYSAQEVKRVQDQTGRYIACPEEIAYRRGYIDQKNRAAPRSRAGQNALRAATWSACNRNIKA